MCSLFSLFISWLHEAESSSAERRPSHTRRWPARVVHLLSVDVSKSLWRRQQISLLLLTRCGESLYWSLREKRELKDLFLKFVAEGESCTVHHSTQKRTICDLNCWIEIYVKLTSGTEQLDTKPKAQNLDGAISIFESVIPGETLTGGGCALISHYQSRYWGLGTDRSNPVSKRHDSCIRSLLYPDLEKTLNGFSSV